MSSMNVSRGKALTLCISPAEDNDVDAHHCVTRNPVKQEQHNGAKRSLQLQKPRAANGTAPKPSAPCTTYGHGWDFQYKTGHLCV